MEIARPTIRFATFERAKIRSDTTTLEDDSIYPPPRRDKPTKPQRDGYQDPGPRL